MAIDIGIGRAIRKRRQDVHVAGMWRDNPHKKSTQPGPNAIESRRAWLACFFICANAAMGLRRPNLIRWTSYMSECVDTLENSVDAAESDKVLCQWARSQHIAEQVGMQFSMDDPFASISISDTQVQFALKGFERDLERWSDQVPADVQRRKLYFSAERLPVSS